MVPPPHPIPGVNVKVPFRGKNMEKMFLYDFYDFMKIENGTKMITSCSIRRVGRRSARPANVLAHHEADRLRKGPSRACHPTGQYAESNMLALLAQLHGPQD